MSRYVAARIPFLVLCALSVYPAPAWSKEPPRIDFRRDIQPIFQAHCYACHGPKRQRNGLRLDIRSAALAGGDSGLVLVPGKSGASVLIRRVASMKAGERMPPRGKPLTAEQIARLRAWVDEGAVWPDDAARTRLADRRDWWSLQPLHRPTVPRLSRADATWARNPIDAFIRAKQLEKGLAPAPEADRRTLIRRLHFDLLGLPPSPADVDAFVADRDPRAYEKLVDRLLSAQAYGERWARHWLDVVHYGDTHGYDKDKVRSHAWPYRDYVIRSFNEDKPYARFVREQLAGDFFYPGTRDGIAALGFLAAGPWDYVGQVELRDGTLDKKITRNLDRDDMVTTTMNTFTSLTAQCARCHDHKFDPITQEDYYSLQAVFAAVDRSDRPLPGGGLVFAAATDFQPAGSLVPTHGRPRPIYVLRRGSEKDPLTEVGPGTVSCIRGLPSRFTVSTPEGQRRAALADWIVDPRNPLTWRSIVNRVWQYHFGQGIVASPNDVGHMGSKPTHPELLDWLAVTFRDGGGSLKDLHRLIVTSATYRQASVFNERFARIDGSNQYLWRMNRRRLEAEEIRDAVLAVSGQLDHRMFGPGFRDFGFLDDHSPHYKYEEFNPEDPASHRRSVYRFIVRSVPDPFMEALDCADPSQAVARRSETLTALQALALLNDRFMVRMAECFAGRVSKPGSDLAAQIATAYRLAFNRKPSADELRLFEACARKYGMPSVCRLIFNTNEFVFID